MESVKENELKANVVQGMPLEEQTGGIRDDLWDILAEGEEPTEKTGDSFFFRYKDQREIAQKIAQQLFGKRYISKRGTKGFYNTELTRTQVGLLTHCLGLQTAASLSQLNYDLSQYGQQINDTLNAIFTSLHVTEEIYEQLKVTTAKENADLLNFNMSPYVTDALDEAGEEEDSEELSVVRSCVESAANVLKALSEIRESIFNQSKLLREGTAAKRIEFTFNGKDGVKPVTEAEMVDIIEKVIRYTLGWLCEACIPAARTIIYEINGRTVYPDGDSRNRIKTLGWNFFRTPKMNTEVYEPSLYMTYSVCSAYMSIANSVRTVRSDLDTLAKKEKKDLQRDDLTVEIELLKKKSLSEQYKKNLSFYHDIQTEFERFRDQCIYAGRYEEKQCKEASINLASEFIGQNYTSVNYEDIENSTTNDAVINTVFHVLILLYSGLDLDYEEAAKKGIVADGEFYDEMQYALQNVLRRWKSLNKTDKGYIIEQYTLSFKERMPIMFTSLSKQLRRQRIQVASLLPMLIRAYNEVSRYLIRYPQKQNVEYLALVLQNRCERDGVKEWSWDREGYNLNSEMHYVKAIVDFYEYYKTYEEPFLEADVHIQTAKMELEKNKMLEIQALQEQQRQVIDELNAVIAEKEREVEHLKSLEAPLVKEVKAIVREEFEKEFGAHLKAIFTELLTAPDTPDSLRYLFNALTLDATFNYRVQGTTQSLFEITDYNSYDLVKNDVENFSRKFFLSFRTKETNN